MRSTLTTQKGCLVSEITGAVCASRQSRMEAMSRDEAVLSSIVCLKADDDNQKHPKGAPRLYVDQSLESTMQIIARISNNSIL